MALAVAAVLLFMPSLARAAVVPLELEELMAVADEVVTVQVEGTNTELYQQLIVTTAKMKVVDTIKGTRKGDLEISFPGGEKYGIVMNVPGYAQFKKGDTAVLFLDNPTEKLPDEVKTKMNSASPLVNSVAVVGGWQGKISVVVPDGEAQAAEKSGAAIPANARVTRNSPRGELPEGSTAPTYAEFKAALQDLAKRQAKIAKSGASSRKQIAGIRGKFAVPDRTNDPVLRMFDPLPPQAYMTKEEVKMLEKRLRGAAVAADDDDKQDK